ncbi:hypothetical protein HQN60_15130 [Deefgea piscis]|uniref:Uncharacterized protein n=1 Tax=Deefgea piscis TaxID=2739061 RepID=A0A6M8SZI4_9NEIS|nr:antiviral RADAR system adenosine triphosphatase RdrA [Deefgea piscis]QKJ67949.1 hypothetical protein HQN60_15130 [Deefgea piscis]
MTDSSEHTIFLPINQGEQAKQKNRNTLLARDVFQKIAELLKNSVAKLEGATKCGEFDDLDEHRAHEAILIDGGRGTGKSSVLVNLQMYMDGEDGLKNKLLILKPVDPTLLENGDDLFLNIIVAALIRDTQIKKALNKGDRKSEEFYEQLQKLGNALEGVQTQKEKHGLDKLRAFIGNHGIADEVHQLFKCALDLTDKKLIVLPIDDVDTSLQHAFENMEVVRKYLASPFVVPIISGDLDLYHDVTWRDFYGRIVKDHKVELIDAKERSKDLANEYQRKVLPFARRIDVPNINDYLNNKEIGLIAGGGNSVFMGLPKLKCWLDALLNERVNGVENSAFYLPIFSIRELVQLISQVKDLLVNLDIEKCSEKEIIRKLICGADVFVKDNAEKSNLMSWYKELRDYFNCHEDGAAAYLVMSTNVEWLGLSEKSEIGEVLYGDLFKPLNHGLLKYGRFNLIDGIRETWGAHVADILPSKQWRSKLPEQCALPYPLLEKGVSSGDFNKKDYLFNSNEQIEFVRQLMFYSGFYNRSQEVDLILTGRVFELLIASLIKDITEKDIRDLLLRAPFYSVLELAGTKTFNLYDEEINEKKAGATKYPNFDLDGVILSLVKAINLWRKEHFLLSREVKPHAWLIYNVMNKYFNQVSVGDSWILDQHGYKYDNSILKYTADVAIRSFESICAIFGSFEKSDIFGVGNKIAFVNGSVASKDFEKNQLYLQNIYPFLREIENPLDSVEFTILSSFTRALYSHPLKDLLKSAFDDLTLSVPEIKNDRINKKAKYKEVEIWKYLSRAVSKFLKKKYPESKNGDAIKLLAINNENNVEFYNEFESSLNGYESIMWEKIKSLGKLSNTSNVGKFFNLMPKDNA